MATETVTRWRVREAGGLAHPIAFKDRLTAVCWAHEHCFARFSVYDTEIELDSLSIERETYGRGWVSNKRTGRSYPGQMVEEF